MAVKAIFLDKDGTLIENVPYNVDPRRVRLARAAERGLRRLRDAGFVFVVISNQPGVALGYFEESALHDVRRRIEALLAEIGVALAGFYYCPHHPEGRRARYATTCECRKPAAGLVRAAAAAHGIDLAASWLIGDILDDVEAGARAGCRTVLLDNGHETEWRAGEFRRPDFTAADIDSAAECIARATHGIPQAARA